MYCPMAENHGDAAVARQHLARCHDVLLCLTSETTYDIKTMKGKWTLDVMFLSTVNCVRW